MVTTSEVTLIHTEGSLMEYKSLAFLSLKTEIFHLLLGLIIEALKRMPEFCTHYPHSVSNVIMMDFMFTIDTHEIW